MGMLRSEARRRQIGKANNGNSCKRALGARRPRAPTPRRENCAERRFCPCRCTLCGADGAGAPRHEICAERRFWPVQVRIVSSLEQRVRSPIGRMPRSGYGVRRPVAAFPYRGAIFGFRRAAPRPVKAARACRTPKIAFGDQKNRERDKPNLPTGAVLMRVSAILRKQSQFPQVSLRIQAAASISGEALRL